MLQRVRSFALATALAVPFALVACNPEEAAKEECMKASASGKVLVQAVDTLTEVAAELSLQVATSCRNIAVAGGQTTQWSGMGQPTNEEVQDACNKASAAIEAKLKAQGSFSLVIEGETRCEANIQAQAECTGSCSASGTCEGGATVACDPGELSVTCDGMCNANATCEGSPEVKVQCEGYCNAQCEGTVTGGCEGTCEGTCDGQASDGKAQGACKGVCQGKCSKPAAQATCKGQCSGSCKLSTPMMCSGSAKCTGGCTGTAREPTCKGQVKPIECNASAECKGACQATAQAKAKCTYPKAKIQAQGNVDASFIAALEAEIPRLIGVAQVQGKAILNVLSTVSGSLEASLKASSACALQAAALVKASVSIQVSVSASASASGSATAN